MVVIIRNHTYYSAVLASLLEQLLGSAIAAARPGQRGLALLHIDLDRFKDLDDLLGREQSDRLLQDAAVRLAAALGPGDRLEHLGGDDFAALIAGAGTLGEAAKVAARLLEECRRDFVYDCIAVRLTASIGIALFPLHADDAAGMVRSAERALYRAKVGGRNRYFPEDIAPDWPLAQIYPDG